MGYLKELIHLCGHESPSVHEDICTLIMLLYEFNHRANQGDQILILSIPHSPSFDSYTLEAVKKRGLGKLTPEIKSQDMFYTSKPPHEL